MIKLTIAFKVFIGYIIILVMFVMVISYAILQIYKFNSLFSSALLENNNIIDYKEKLIYSLLSQMRYERKYIISKDKARYDQFLSAKNDFSKYLLELTALIP